MLKMRGLHRLGLASVLVASWLIGPAVAAPAAAVEAPNPAVTARMMPVQRAEPRPAIWLLSDGDTRIYLFGTVHILHPELRWRSPALDRVVREADELVLELDEAEMARTGPELFGPMMLDKAHPILERVSPERREPLGRMIAEYGLSQEGLDRMQTWAVTMILVVTGMIREYAPDGEPGSEGAGQVPGVEEVLTADFRANGRSVTGVERVEDQILAFRDLPAGLQTAMLEAMVDDYVSGAPAGNADETAWITGDVDSLAAEMETMPPEMFDALITRRNRNWTNWLIARLDRPGTVLFAVGAGHLAGSQSVQEMLAARGFRVTRLN